MEDKKPGVEPKSIEQILREKFKTGYDPVTLSVRARAINEEGLDISIEGHKFVVRGNVVLFISKGECGTQIPQAKTEEAAAQEEGKAAIAAVTAPTGVLPEEGNTASPQSEPVHASDCATHNEPATPNGPCDCEAGGFTPDRTKPEDTAPSEVEPA